MTDNTIRKGGSGPAMPAPAGEPAPPKKALATPKAGTGGSSAAGKSGYDGTTKNPKAPPDPFFRLSGKLGQEVRAKYAACQAEQKKTEKNPDYQPKPYPYLAGLNLEKVAGSLWFSRLPEARQREVLGLLERSADDPNWGPELGVLWTAPGFRGLGEETKDVVLDALGGVAGDIWARKELIRLANVPGFAALDGREQVDLVRYVGGHIPLLSRPASRAVDRLLNTAEYARADVEGQAAQLRRFLLEKPGVPAVVSSGNDRLLQPPAPYELVGPVKVASHTFHSGIEDASRYDLKMPAQQIPLWSPAAPPSKDGTLPATKDVALGVAALPEELRRFLKVLVLEPGRDPDDAYFAQAYGPTLEPEIRAKLELEVRAEVEAELAKVPSEERAARLGPEVERRLAQRTREKVAAEFRSYMTASADGTVSVYPAEGEHRPEVINASLVHEVGHIVAARAWGPTPASAEAVAPESKGWEPWIEAMRADGRVPSNYARGSIGEDLAESLELYWLVKGTNDEEEARRSFPARFAVIDRLLAAPPPPP